jgi:hypothetical protein
VGSSHPSSAYLLIFRSLYLVPLGTKGGKFCSFCLPSSHRSLFS